MGRKTLAYKKRSDGATPEDKERSRTKDYVNGVSKKIKAPKTEYNYWQWKVEPNKQNNMIVINGKSSEELLGPDQELNAFLPIYLSMLENSNIHSNVCIARGDDTSYEESPFNRLVSKLKSLKWQFTKTQSISLSSFFSGCNTLLKAGPGTGKTLAYIIAAIFHCVKREDDYVKRNSRKQYQSLSEGYGSTPEAIVVVPNTELANQVHHLAHDIVTKAGYDRLNPSICTGDMKRVHMDQISEGSRFIIGVPASFIHYSKGSTTSTHCIQLTNVSLLICDEYRIMMHNCSNSMNTIKESIKKDAQIILVGNNGYNRIDNSAPIDEKAKSFLEASNNKFREIEVEDESAHFISHHYHILNDSEEKEDWLINFLKSDDLCYRLEYTEEIRGKKRKVIAHPDNGKCIILANDQAMVKRIGSLLDRKGFRNIAQSHGGMSKTRKNVALEEFKEKRSKTRILIATFNGSKGLDYGSEPMFVVNFVPPVNVQAYADAAGRNGRHGTGCVITLFSPGQDARFAYQLSGILEKELKHKDNTDWRPLKPWAERSLRKKFTEELIT